MKRKQKLLRGQLPVISSNVNRIKLSGNRSSVITKQSSFHLKQYRYTFPLQLCKKTTTMVILIVLPVVKKPTMG